jgi:hypothetical protein
MNAEQENRTTKALSDRPHLKPLYDFLLDLGGDFAVIWWEGFHTSPEFVDALLKLGRVSSGAAARLRRMQSNHCHENAQALAAKHPERYQ